MSLTITRKVSISGGTVLRAANNLGDVADMATAQSNLGIPQGRNALAPAQALSGNGTAGSTMSVQAPGPALTIAFTANPTTLTGNLGVLDSTTGANAGLLIFASGEPSIYNGAAYKRAGVTATASVNDFWTYTLTAGTGTWYKNGVVSATMADAGTYADIINGVGKSAAGTPFTGTLRLLGIDTIALSPAEVLQLYQTGSWPSSHFAQGVNDSGTTVYAGAQMINGANSTFASDAGWWTKGGTATINSAVAGKANIPAGGSLDRASVLTVGKRYRAAWTQSGSTGAGLGLYDGVTAFAASGTDGAKSVEFTATGTQFLIGSASGTGAGVVDDLTLTPIGLLVAPDPMQPGNGLTCGDRSGNGAHILLPASGVDWLLPSAAVNKLRGTTSTSGNQQLLGGTTLNANTQITRVRARSRSGTPSITLGTDSGGSQIVASVALSTTWKDLTIALTGGIISTASSVWVGSTTADVVEIDLTHEPLGY